MPSLYAARGELTGFLRVRLSFGDPICWKMISFILANWAPGLFLPSPDHFSNLHGIHPCQSQRSVAVSGNGHAVHCYGICYWGRLRASNTGATLRHWNRWGQTHIRFPHKDPYLKSILGILGDVKSKPLSMLCEMTYSHTVSSTLSKDKKVKICFSFLPSWIVLLSDMLLPVFYPLLVLIAPLCCQDQS